MKKIVYLTFLLGLCFSCGAGAQLDIPEVYDFREEGVRYTIGSISKGSDRSNKQPALCMTYDQGDVKKDDFQDCLMYNDIKEAIAGIDNIMKLFKDSVLIYQQYVDPNLPQSRNVMSKLEVARRMGFEMEMRRTNDSFVLQPFIHFRTYGPISKEDRTPLKDSYSLVRVKELLLLAKAKIEADHPKIK